MDVFDMQLHPGRPDPDLDAACDLLRTAAAHPDSPIYGSDLMPWIDDITTDWRRLRARVAALERALRPFAAWAERLSAMVRDDHPVGLVSWLGQSTTVGDLRAAGRALRGDG